MNKETINQKYLELHNALGKRKDAEDKEAFDIAHRKVWADCNTELKARKVELEMQGVDGSELKELQIMFPKPDPPRRNLEAEIDELKAKLDKALIKINEHEGLQ